MPFLPISDGRTYSSIPAGDIPKPLKDNGKLFAKFDGTKVQLFWLTNEGDVYQITPPGSSGNTSLASVIWRPGVPSAGDAYETWVEIEARIAAENGNIIVQCDNQFGALIVPATANTECFGRTIFRAYTFKADASNIFTIADGGVIRNPSEFDNLLVTVVPTITAPIVLDIGGSPLLLNREAGIVLDAGATTNAVQCDEDLTGCMGFFGISFANNTGNPALGILNIAAAITAIYVDGFAVEQGLIPNRPSNMWQGDITTAIIQSSDASVGIILPQSAFAGVLTYNPTDQTLGMYYEDAFTNPQIVETTVQGALDHFKKLVLGAGTTASRPLAVDILPGAMYFDTTLGLPIWFNGVAYVDAAGVVV